MTNLSNVEMAIMNLTDKEHRFFNALSAEDQCSVLKFGIAGFKKHYADRLEEIKSKNDDGTQTVHSGKGRI